VAVTEKERIDALLKEKTTEAANSLHALAETTGDKETRKAARKALYLLRQKGIVPDTPAVIETALAPRSAIETIQAAYVSNVDGGGAQMVIVQFAGRDGGRPTLCQILVRDDVGVRDFFTVKMTPKEIEKFISGETSNRPDEIHLAAVEVDYARWLIARARHTTQNLRLQSPRGFLDLFSHIGEPENQNPASPVYSLVSVEAIREDDCFSREASDLFSQNSFVSWFLDAESMYPWLNRFAEVRKNSEEPPEEQAERSEQVLSEVINAEVSAELRALYTRRLEDTAYVLWQNGEIEAAKKALYHALDLAENKPASEVPFARLLVQRTMGAAIQSLVQHLPPEQRRLYGEMARRE
jgi:hypothetical protein